ncbi:choice-of-anchor Q domain-containing protein [Pontiella agarivorans]|uniref:Choice-of-anchor Q domain-containing protein n=1 Tax=Pontiella agarivorans TaxID=3038953 RepID=A0ABU5N216_9BACT|nr:choice-of-anchor Q domain-containing protein [Pontiella agarivorans]MDZ8120470.1 choice-of-anchor Q domain-containing protein [Pontiella agarivorans]
MNTEDAGPGSLRQAILDAALDEVITFSTNLSGQTIHLTGGELTLGKNETIDASALAEGIILDAAHLSRIFVISNSSSNHLHGLTIQNGTYNSQSRGAGGIFCYGYVELTDCTVQSNDRGIYTSYGEVSLVRSTISGNSDLGMYNYNGIINTFQTEISDNPDGGIFNETGTIAIDQSTVARNTSSSGGGLKSITGPIKITQSTFADNFSTNSGGALSITSGDLTILQSTFSSNASSNSGGAIYFNSGTFNITNSIVCGNSAPVSPNIDGTLNSSHNNLIDIDALLTPLGDYGGPTPSMPPQPGSPAIDTGTSLHFSTDQRGYSRIYGEAKANYSFSNTNLVGVMIVTEGSAPETGTITNNSFLLTPETEWQKSSLILPDLGLMAGFSASFKYRYTAPSNSVYNPADGMSFSFGPAPTVPVGENGITTDGHAVSFNLYNGNHPTDAAFRYIRTTDDPLTFTSPIPFGRFTDANKWHDIEIQLDPEGILNVWFNGSNVLENIQTDYSPTPGDRFTFGARTASGFSEQRIDEIRVTVGRQDIGAAEWTPLEDPIWVTILDDVVDTIFTNGISLREAIQYNRSIGGGCSIGFDPALNGQILAQTNSQFTINQNLTIDASNLPNKIQLY